MVPFDQPLHVLQLRLNNTGFHQGYQFVLALRRPCQHLSAVAAREIPAVDHANAHEDLDLYLGQTWDLDCDKSLRQCLKAPPSALLMVSVQDFGDLSKTRGLQNHLHLIHFEFQLKQQLESSLGWLYCQYVPYLDQASVCLSQKERNYWKRHLPGSPWGLNLEIPSPGNYEKDSLNELAPDAFLAHCPPLSLVSVVKLMVLATVLMVQSVLPVVQTHDLFSFVQLQHLQICELDHGPAPLVQTHQFQSGKPDPELIQLFQTHLLQVYPPNPALIHVLQIHLPWTAPNLQQPCVASPPLNHRHLPFHGIDLRRPGSALYYKFLVLISALLALEAGSQGLNHDNQTADQENQKAFFFLLPWPSLTTDLVQLGGHMRKQSLLSVETTLCDDSMPFLDHGLFHIGQ